MATGELTGIQKAAVVLINMGQPYASEVLKEFSEMEAEEIASEIIRMRKVDSDTIEKAIDAFYEIAVQGRTSILGGEDFASELLEATFGSEKAGGVLKRASSSNAGRSFEFLDDVAAENIATLLEGEMPQTIAVVLAHLQAAQASAVIASLTEEVRTDVAQSIATMSSATPESIQMLAHDLKGRAAAVASTRPASAAVVGGLQSLVDIINRADVNTERTLLEGLEARDPELAEEIRSRLLTFADIVKLDQRDIQEVLRGIDLGILAKAMKGAGDQVVEVIRTNLSERKLEMLDEELKDLGSLRKKDVEEARADVVRSIRELAESGAITVHREADEEDELID